MFCIGHSYVNQIFLVESAEILAVLSCQAVCLGEWPLFLAPE